MPRVTTSVISGTVTSVTAASGGLSQSITAVTPTMLSTLAMSCVTLSLSTLLTLSMSLARRLINSPWARWSKKRSDSSCMWLKRSARMSRTASWATPAMM